MTLNEILKDSTYKLSEFSPAQIQALENSIIVKETRGKTTPYVTCLKRGKEFKLTPEEIVRQLYVRVLMENYGYDKSRIQLEYPVQTGSSSKRADIVVFEENRPTQPYIIVELKEPNSKEGRRQLESYCKFEGAAIGVWSNGNETAFFFKQENPKTRTTFLEKLTYLPKAGQTLSEVLDVRFTIKQLLQEDKLQEKSLKDIILEFEDIVLANSGVDSFEEIFKLLFTKLYDEYKCSADADEIATLLKYQTPLTAIGDAQFRQLEFRNTGTEAETQARLSKLFDEAVKKWSGIFPEGTKFSLTATHLKTCVSYLQDVKLFNSNLEVVDDAFEYLVNKEQKGDKGQYFTPRYVIDMCVKMLNPQAHETMIDTAAGSCGFPMHTIFYVWNQLNPNTPNLLTTQKRTQAEIDYVQNKVFAIDFDLRSVRVGRTLNIIAGDGHTNVLLLNTLDFTRWDHTTTDRAWLKNYNIGYSKLEELRTEKNSNRSFQFDLLMANPPFAGEISDDVIIHNHSDVSKKPDGKFQNKIGRDILFIERNLNYLKPGGRMAVVLPQGRFNNSSDKAIREFIAGQCRILAVVGLHGNVFKPHTGTKTSVLLVQKWNDDASLGALCPRADDYPIFFATMTEPSKDNSGEKIYRKDVNGNKIKDDHGHFIVQHDLFSTKLADGSRTPDGIAEAFIEFAKKENLSFFELGLPGSKNLAGLYVEAFDEVKYQLLLEEQEISEVMLSNARLHNSVFRFDAQYFQKKFLKEDESIAKYPIRLLGDIAFITDGQHGYHEVDEFSDIRHITAKNAKGWFVNDEGADRIAKWVDDKNKRSSLQLNDVILSTRGTVGLCAIVDNDILPANIDQDVARIDIDENICKATALIAYLNSVIGQDWIVRNSTGMVQQGLALWRLKELPIPIFTTEFQSKIDSTIQEARLTRISSRTTYNQAENLLLNALGMADFSPSTENVNVKSFKNSFLASGRLDAEYYQPKYENYVQQIKSYKNGFKSISDVLTVPIKNGTTPNSVIAGYNTSEHYFVRVEAFQQNLSIDETFFHSLNNEDYLKYKSNLVLKNDILVSMTGTIGAVVIYSPNKPALINQNVMRLRCNTNLINTESLAVYLRTIGKVLLERVQTGNVQPYVNTSNFETLIVPLIDFETQTQIANLVQQSFTLKTESERLLATAKRAVEIAIETDEQAAMAFINSHTGE